MGKQCNKEELQDLATRTHEARGRFRLLRQAMGSNHPATRLALEELRTLSAELERHPSGPAMLKIIREAEVRLALRQWIVQEHTVVGQIQTALSNVSSGGPTSWQAAQAVKHVPDAATREVLKGLLREIGKAKNRNEILASLRAAVELAKDDLLSGKTLSFKVDGLPTVN